MSVKDDLSFIQESVEKGDVYAQSTEKKAEVVFANVKVAERNQLQELKKINDRNGKYNSYISTGYGFVKGDSVFTVGLKADYIVPLCCSTSTLCAIKSEYFG